MVKGFLIKHVRSVVLVSIKMAQEHNATIVIAIV